MSAVKTQYTSQDLLDMPEGERYELAGGRLVERKMGSRAAWIAGRFHFRLEKFIEKEPLGFAFPDGASYKCFPDDPEKVRRPDGSFIQFGRLPGEEIPEGHIPIAPDLVVEVTSPNDLHVEVAMKVQEYLRAGVRVVWVVTPETRTVQEHRLDRAESRRLSEEDELCPEDVLPGFRCLVRDLFPPAT